MNVGDLIVPKKQQTAHDYQTISDAEQMRNGTVIDQPMVAYTIKKLHPMPNVAEAKLSAYTLCGGCHDPSHVIINLSEWKLQDPGERIEY